MANRRMQNSDYLYDKDDDLLGLTSAFPAVKGPQSVEYDKGDEAIGLTGAFAPIVLEPDEKPWDEGGKWSGFDWESYHSETAEEPAGDAANAAPEAPAPEADGAAEDGAGADKPAAEPAAGKTPAPASGGSGRGRHAAPEAAMSPRMQQARKKRRTLIIVLILNLAKVLNLFESVFVMYNNRVFEVSDVISTYIYRKTFMTAIPNYGYSTAVGLFKSIVGCALVLICNRASKKVRGRGII